jgi:hypothetical protein
MKKSELQKQLDALQGDPEIWLAKDEEGNDFHPVDRVVVEYAATTSRYYGFEVLHPDDIEDVKDRYDKIEIVAVIWPGW